MDINEVIETALIAIYKDDVLNETLYLKGGQALRFSENLTDRFSKDIDFSIRGKLINGDPFFKNLKRALYKEFISKGFYLFDFKPIKKPKIKKVGTPDFWGGWRIEFKIINSNKKVLPTEEMRRQALMPLGSNSTAIPIDVSEYEYCQSIEKVKIKSVEVQSYSRLLIVLEKLRAICQQHPDYKLVSSTPKDRSRDYYDIERLLLKAISENTMDIFIDEARKHISGVFNAKEVPLVLLGKIFEKNFMDIQELGWKGLRSTVSVKVQDFEYYNETLKSFIQELNLDLTV